MARTSGNCLVQVGKTGGEVRTYALNGDRTVRSSFEAAGMEVSASSRIKLNGKDADLTSTVKNGDIVTLAGNIKGGKE